MTRPYVYLGAVLAAAAVVAYCVVSGGHVGRADPESLSGLCRVRHPPEHRTAQLRGEGVRRAVPGQDIGRKR